MKRCAFCGGRLGLISHRKGNLSFCKRVHKSAYLERQREYQRAEDRRRSWLDFPAAGRPDRFRSCRKHATALPRRFTPVADRVSLGAVSRHQCL